MQLVVLVLEKELVSYDVENYFEYYLNKNASTGV
jgi:hypothetical protein